MQYSFEADAGVSWETVLTGDALEATLRELGEQRSYSWDVETNGLRPFMGNHIIGHSFAWRRQNGQMRSVYMPMRHKTHLGLFDQIRQLEPDQVTAGLKPILENPANSNTGFNLHFDALFAHKDGIDVHNKIHDSLVGERLRDENHRSYKLHQCLPRAGVKHDPEWKNGIVPDLKAQAKSLRINLTEVRDKHGYEFVAVDRMGFYACQDTIYEYRLTETQMPHVGEWGETWPMEMELFWVCLDMAKIGVPVAPQILQDLAAEQQAIMDTLGPEIWQLVGDEFEITKDAQLRKILFEKLGMEPQGETDSGASSVDADSLWKLTQKYNSPAIPKIREYRERNKIVTTYSLSILELTDEHNILHPQIIQSGAKTGRVSCSAPNLQNIPIRTELGRRVREAFQARRGMIRYCLDYSQVELRILAHLSQDPLLLKIYRSGLDAHRSTAIEAFGTAEKVNGVDMRRIAKILNFGVSFGMTEIGLMGNINKDLPEGQEPINEAKAKQFLASFYSKYKGVDAYRKALWYLGRRNNGLLHNLFGRQQHVPDLNHEKRWIREQAERQATSRMVQGGAADLVKRCMIVVHQYLKSQQDCEADLVLMVHDDLQMDMAPDGSAKVIREIHRLMEVTCQPKLSVPIKVDTEWFTTNWKEKKSMVIN